MSLFLVPHFEGGSVYNGTNLAELSLTIVFDPPSLSLMKETFE